MAIIDSCWTIGRDKAFYKQRDWKKKEMLIVSQYEWCDEAHVAIQLWMKYSRYFKIVLNWSSAVM
jgi:hypothetical protein